MTDEQALAILKNISDNNRIILTKLKQMLEHTYSLCAMQEDLREVRRDVQEIKLILLGPDAEL